MEIQSQRLATSRTAAWLLEVVCRIESVDGGCLLLLDLLFPRSHVPHKASTLPREEEAIVLEWLSHHTSSITQIVIAPHESFNSIRYSPSSRIVTPISTSHTLNQPQARLPPGHQ